MKLIPCLLGSALALASATVFAQARWDMPTPYPETNFHTKNVKQFADEVNADTSELRGLGVDHRIASARAVSLTPADLLNR